MRGDKEGPDLESIGQELAAVIDRKRRVEAKLPPISQPIGPFRSAIETMVRNQSAGKFGLGAPSKSVIEMLLKGPLTDLGDFGVVDLDFVRGQSGARFHCGKRDGCKQKSAEDLLVHGKKFVRSDDRSWRRQGLAQRRGPVNTAIFAWKERGGCGSFAPVQEIPTRSCPIRRSLGRPVVRAA